MVKKDKNKHKGAILQMLLHFLQQNSHLILTSLLMTKEEFNNNHIARKTMSQAPCHNTVKQDIIGHLASFVVPHNNVV